VVHQELKGLLGQLCGKSLRCLGQPKSSLDEVLVLLKLVEWSKLWVTHIKLFLG